MLYSVIIIITVITNKVNFKNMAQIIKADGTKIDVIPKNGTDFQLSELQEIVGGYIEIVFTKDDQLMVVNDEGKLNGLPINEEATKLVGYDLIVGDVLVCASSQIK